jgi:hypothetical protein
MLAVMPDTVHKALGDALGDVAVRDFTVWLETAMTEHTVGQDAWSQAQVRFDNLEAGQAKLETGLAKLEAGQAKLEAGQANLEVRMTNVETRLTMVEHDVADLKVDVRDLRRDMHERFDRQASEVNTRFAEVNVRFDQLQVQMLSQMRWTVGTLALFGTLIAILVGIGQLRT